MEEKKNDTARLMGIHMAARRLEHVEGAAEIETQNLFELRAGITQHRFANIDGRSTNCHVYLVVLTGQAAQGIVDCGGVGKIEADGLGLAAMLHDAGGAASSARGVHVGAHYQFPGGRQTLRRRQSDTGGCTGHEGHSSIQAEQGGEPDHGGIVACFRATRFPGAGRGAVEPPHRAQSPRDGRAVRSRPQVLFQIKKVSMSLYTLGIKLLRFEPPIV